jgi:cytoskeleton protein RodZ
MFEIGASLREARARRKLGYDQVEAETKIRAKYIRCMEDEQFDVLPSGTYVRGFLRTYADYLGLDGQLYVDEYSSRFGDLPAERVTRRRERPQPRRNESSNAVLIALAGIVAVGVLLLAAWKLNPSSDRPNTPMPPPVTVTKQVGTAGGGNPSSYSQQQKQEKALAVKAKRATTILTPKLHPVTLRIDVTGGEASWLVIRRLSNLKKIVYQSVLKAPSHIGGKMQKDPKGYLVAVACNPAAISLTVNGKPYGLSGTTGPWRVTADGVVPTRVPAGVPVSGC